MSRFTIRDMLWLMVIAGVLAAWWIDRRSQAAAAQESQELARIVMWASNYGDVEPGSEEWIAIEKSLRREWLEIQRKREERRLELTRQSQKQQ